VTIPSAQRPRTLREILEAHERLVIFQTLAACDGSRSKAAETLGISRARLYARLHKLSVDLEVLPKRSGRPRKK
jgi:DNA-binding NtrC family response regulator